jgi:penicillin-binding protein 2
MKISRGRVAVLLVVVVLCICAFTVRLMRYQITDGAAYRKQASKSTVESISIAAPRGEILDRYGTVLATNSVGYSMILEYSAFSSSKTGGMNPKILQITETMSQCGQSWNDLLPISTSAPWAYASKTSSDLKTLKNRLVTLKLVAAKDKDTVTADKVMQLLRRRYSIPSNYSDAQARNVIGVRYSMEMSDFMVTVPYTFASNVSLDCINRIGERSVAGIEISQSYSRVYPDGTLAPHLIGYVGKQSEKQYAANKSKGYQLSDYIGQSGLEAAMESELRGTSGVESITINSTGTVTGSDITTAPKPGNNIVTTLDSNLQKVLQQSLADTIADIRSQAGGSLVNGAQCNAGSAVVLNIKSGEVLAMATCPSYDNNAINKNYTAILNTAGKPLNNRALMAYRPGSTFKPCVAVSALMNGVVSKDESIYCGGEFLKYAPSYIGRDDGYYGSISIIKAIGVSSNVFFDTLGDRLNIKSNTLLEQTAKALGLGQPTGIELSESTGVVSGPTEKKAKGGTWYPADAVQTAIGQLDNLYTPLQLANYVGTICNGGKRMEVHLVKEIKSYDNTKTISEKSPKVVSDLKISDEIVNIVKQGMYQVTQGDRTGTAAAVFENYSLPVGGKTGTAEVTFNIGGTVVNGYNGLFVLFAPYDNPQIAVAVAVENCQWGSQTAPVALSALNYLYMNTPAYPAAQTSGSNTGTLLK